MLREARRRCQLSQAELARRAGIPPSVLCVYEAGRREPGAGALERILAAAGLSLSLTSGGRGGEIDLERAGRLLEQVLDLAEALPGRRRGPLRYPPFRAQSR